MKLTLMESIVLAVIEFLLHLGIDPELLGWKNQDQLILVTRIISFVITITIIVMIAIVAILIFNRLVGGKNN